MSLSLSKSYQRNGHVGVSVVGTSLESWLLSGEQHSVRIHSASATSPQLVRQVRPSQGSDLGSDLLTITGLVGVGQKWGSWTLVNCIMLLRAVNKNTH